jgi:hypothetical protein
MDDEKIAAMLTQAACVLLAEKWRLAGGPTELKPHDIENIEKQVVTMWRRIEVSIKDQR